MERMSRGDKMIIAWIFFFKQCFTLDNPMVFVKGEDV